MPSSRKNRREEINSKEIFRALKSTACPTLAHVRALGANSLPNKVKVSIEQHLKACRICQTLLQDLKEMELPDLTPEEEDRIRSRVFGARKILKKRS
jgi:hypothetical protein